MSFDSFLKLISILFIFIVACTSNQQINTVDSCILFDQKKSWYKATKNSYDNWQTPIALQLAIINQESSFNQFAKPKRNFFLVSSQVLDPRQLLVMLKLPTLLGIGIKIKLAKEMLQELIFQMLLILLDGMPPKVKT